VPAGTILPPPLAGDIVAAAPLQTVAVCAITSGTGFTVTVTLKAVPGQVPEVGVTEYTTFVAVLLVLVKVCEKLAEFVPELIPEIPATAAGAAQV
jgi:hypothetical protein